MIDPITGMAILGGTTMLYNTGSYLYNWYYQEDIEIIDSKKEKECLEYDEKIEEEFSNKVEEVKKVFEDIQQKYEIDYDDVIIELINLFEYQNPYNSEEE